MATLTVPHGLAVANLPAPDRSASEAQHQYHHVVGMAKIRELVLESVVPLFAVEEVIAEPVHDMSRAQSTLAASPSPEPCNSRRVTVTLHEGRNTGAQYSQDAVSSSRGAWTSDRVQASVPSHVSFGGRSCGIVKTSVRTASDTCSPSPPPGSKTRMASLLPGRIRA